MVTTKMLGKWCKTAFGVLLSALLISEVAAKTTYVETFGTANPNCSKTEPCNTIQDAIDVAGVNGRVIVGPGVYNENIAIVEPGVKLISVAGAHATIIEGDTDVSPPPECVLATTMVCIAATAARATFGQKRKGFTVTGNFGGEDAIHTEAARTRIEGNIVVDPVGVASSDSAFSIGGIQATVRNNEVYDFALGLDASMSGIDNVRHNVSENAFSNIYLGDCIKLLAGANGRSLVKRNVMTACGGDGIAMEGSSAAEKSGDRIYDNVMVDVISRGIDYRDGGSPDIRNNLVVNAGVGIEINDVDGANIRKNLLKDISGQGFSAGTSNGTRFNDNTLVDMTGSSAFEIQEVTATFSQIRKNNFLNVNCPIDIHGVLASDVVFSGNFWGDPTDPNPDLSCNAAANTDPRLFLNPSAKLNPVKYKSPI